MQEQQVRVGDVAAWGKMPDGAMFYWAAYDDHYIKLGHRLAVRCSTHGREWFDLRVAPIVNFDEWVSNPNAAFKVLALDVPADATAADLQRLAKVFEVREAVSSLISADGPWLLDDAPPAIVLYLSRGQQLTVVELDADGVTTSHALDAAAKKLHRAGWRPGMTAEDAARMLADLAPGCPDGLGCELCFDQDDPA